MLCHIPFLISKVEEGVFLGEGTWWVLMGQAEIIVLGEASVKVLLVVGSFWDLPVLLSPGTLLPCTGDPIFPWCPGGGVVTP